MSKILVVVDMQNDFLTGSLANESAVAIIPNIKREIESGYYDHIIFTRDTHHDNYLETQEGKNLPVVHCIEGTWGWEVCDELMSAHEGSAKVHFVNKPTFGYKDWDKMSLHINDIETSEITFVGTVTSICVCSNALIFKSIYPDTSVNCISNCCAGLNDENHKSALEVMKSCQIDVIE